MDRKFIPSGIPGLDKLLGGGLLEGSIVAVSGPTGVGKSTLAMQFIHAGAKIGEPGLYIAIEESRQDLLFHFNGFNWNIEGMEKDRKILILDYPIHEVDQILTQYGAVQDIIQSTGVKRVVIDSIMPVGVYFKGDDERRVGFLKLIENIRKWGITSMIISEDLPSNDLHNLPASEYGIESYTDGWINLFYVFDDKEMHRKRFIEVLKMKGVSHSTRACSVHIDSDGMRVLSVGSGSGAPSPSPPQFEEPVIQAQRMFTHTPSEDLGFGKPQTKKTLAFKMSPPSTPGTRQSVPSSQQPASGPTGRAASGSQSPGDEDEHEPPKKGAKPTTLAAQRSASGGSTQKTKTIAGRSSQPVQKVSQKDIETRLAAVKARLLQKKKEK